MADPTTKAELLTMMQQSYNDFEALLAPLSEEQLTTPFMENDWSMRDMLAHITTWQQRGVLRLEAVRQNKEADTPVIRTDEEADRYTRAQLQKYQGRSLAEVRYDFRASYRQLVTAVTALGEELLFEPGRFEWMDGAALWACPRLYTCEHYEEHTADIEHFLALHR